MTLSHVALREDTARIAANPVRDVFFVKVGRQLKRINVAAVQFIEVDEKYCALCLAERTVHVKMPLSQVMERFDSGLFVRVHRSFVVNVNYVDSIHLQRNVVMIAGREVPVSRTYRDNLLGAIPKL